jgi:regulatory protein PHO2
MSQYSTSTSPQTRSRARALAAPPRPSTSTRRENYDESIASSPEPTEQTRSPDLNLTSTRSSPLGSDSELLSFDDEKEPASGPQRLRAVSNASTGTKGEKEKRKRSRVTPEQLVHLERFFAVDRSPPAARRREISERLGMHERQTQIWFQNRCGHLRWS